MTDFHLYSTHQSHSQTGLYHYTLLAVTNRHEGTFRSLRYSFGGDHPSQTTHHAMSSVRTQLVKGWYFNVGSPMARTTGSTPPTYPTHRIVKPNAKL